MPSKVTGRMILSRRHVPVLAHFAASNVLVAFDYDGTLAPIVPTPTAARMRQTTRHLLTRVAKRYPCVVISGRRLDDLRRRLRSVPVWHLVGDHGSESAGTTGAVSAQVQGWVAQLRQQLPDRKGLVIEQKRHSVTVHYRHVRDKRRVLERLAGVVHQLRDARAIYSPEAINVLPNQGAHKGLALQQACRAFDCDTAIYIGDDDTDEDAFTSAGPEQLLSIRVGTKHPSKAQYRLKRQADVDDLLEMLIELRKKQA
ncbi:MAG: trehalose-phosphatase [Vicinamibacterales bacterium]